MTELLSTLPPVRNCGEPHLDKDDAVVCACGDCVVREQCVSRDIYEFSVNLENVALGDTAPEFEQLSLLFYEEIKTALSVQFPSAVYFLGSNLLLSSDRAWSIPLSLEAMWKRFHDCLQTKGFVFRIKRPQIQASCRSIPIACNEMARNEANKWIVASTSAN